MIRTSARISRSIPSSRTIVAIPARDEAERIAACLEALDCQDGAQLDDIVLLVNNSADDTAELARSVKVRHPTRLHVIERTLSPELANAGSARRIAMEEAARLAGSDGVILTTDADGLVDPDWLIANLAAIRAGADAVAGWVELHPVEWGAIPARLHEDDARECAYDALCDEIHAVLDPDPWDPHPRHTQHSGASIAVTASAFAKCGGVPRTASGEDRALIAALRRVDARVRHSPEVHVTVSGRTTGRAAGGMADTIKRRLSRPDPYMDDRLEPAANCALRAFLRAETRRAHAEPAFDRRGLTALLGIDPEEMDAILRAPHFGTAWEAIEARAACLRHELLPVGRLAEETAAARRLLDVIRKGSRLPLEKSRLVDLILKDP